MVTRSKKIDYSLDAITKRLKAERIGVAVIQRGDKLSIRATLPPKQGSSKNMPYQQSISLGFYANEQGLEQSESLAREMGAQLASNRFSWEAWTQFTPASVPTALEFKKVGEWLQSFEAELRAHNPITDCTWRTNYQLVFSKLPKSELLTDDLLTNLVLDSKPNTRERKRRVEALAKLAKFAGLEVDLSGLKGDYSASSVDPRELPTDERLIEIWRSLPDDPWRTAFSRLLVFGLRPHEAWFFVDESTATLQRFRITRGKTGPRVVYPLRPEWLSLFSPIGEMPYADLTTSYDKLGKTFWDHWRDRHAKNPRDWKPYDLRHCYARRGMSMGLPPDWMAKAMGHSLDVHLRTYRQWIQQSAYDAIYEGVVGKQQNGDPPK